MSNVAHEVKEILKILRDSEVAGIVNFDVKDGKEETDYSKAYMEGAEKRGAAIPVHEWSELTPWGKMCVFKVSDTAGVDCDVALRSVVIYWLTGMKPATLAEPSVALEWKIEKQEDAKQPGGAHPYQLRADQASWVLRGDTMNSYATPIHGYFRKVFSEEDRKKLKQNGIVDLKDNTMYVKAKYCRKSDNYHWERAVLENYDIFETLLSHEALLYIRLSHTLGNFISVPFALQKRGRFNSPRGFGPSNDFWDLALVCIYNYYGRKEKHSLEWLLDSPQPNTQLCEKWLNAFGSWDAFVQKNFLQDFVNQNPNGTFGAPKEFWDGHFNGSELPEKPEDYQQFFTNVSAMITARGERIAQAIKDRLRDKDLEELAKEMVRCP